jgi:hypothetical protein
MAAGGWKRLGTNCTNEANEKMVRFEKPIIAFFVVVDLLLVAVCLLGLYLGLPRRGQAQLCQGLGVQDETLCREGSGVGPLLDAVFEPGVTRRDEVQALLEAYFVAEHERFVGGTAETYRLVWTPLGETRAYFSFDAADVLISITVED